MKNFLLLFSVITLFTFTQCCPDSSAHEPAKDVSLNYFEGTVSLQATKSSNVGLLLVDFKKDHLRYVLYYHPDVDAPKKDDIVYFKIKNQGEIPIAHSIDDTLPENAKLDMNPKFRHDLKIDYHCQFNHNCTGGNSHSILHKLKPGSLNYDSNSGISTFIGIVTTPDLSEEELTMMMNGIFDPNQFPYNASENFTAFFEPIGGDDVEPILAEFSVQHYHRH